MIAALVLAGGAGRRMGGVDKAALAVGGATLLDRVLAAARPVCDRLVVVGPERPTGVEGVTFVQEREPGGGPVPAVAAGLAEVPDAGAVLVLAVDLPLLTGGALRRLLAALDAGAEAAAAAGQGGPNPLLAAYSAPALRARAGALGAGARAAALLPAGVATVDLGRATLNVNRPEDLAGARRIVGDAALSSRTALGGDAASRDDAAWTGGPTMAEFEAYHGQSSEHHQARFDALAPKGWHMISLSVHGAASDPRYTVVWVKEKSPAYTAVHDLPIGRYQQWFVDQTEKGYAPVLVGATGTGADAVVAAVFEKGVKGGWLAKHGLTSGSDQNQATIDFWNKEARRRGMVLRSGSVYGIPSQRLYIAVWQEEPAAYWNWRTAETPANYQKWFDAFGEVPLRPGFVTLSDQQEYFAAFRNDSVGEWRARHGLTGAAYQQAFDDSRRDGFYPISVQGGGKGAGTRYAAIFARRHTPKPRKWTVQGSGKSTFDAAVKEFMVANDVRAGQLAVAKGGAFKAERAYTWADEDYPTTETGTLMRVASLSKMFTAACIQALYDAGTLKEGDKAFSKAGITTKALSSQTLDSRVKDITVEQLIDHTGGWDSSIAGDFVFRMRQIAIDLGLSGPATKFDVVRYAFGEPLQNKPGTTSKYSNIGYTTLAYLVEKVSGQSYETYLTNTILTPAGITDVRVARTLRKQRFPNEAFYDDPNVSWSAAQPTQQKRTAYCYGGEGWTTEAMDGSGGLCATSRALVQFVRQHAVWGRGGRAAGAARTGSMAGVSSRAGSRTDDVDYAFVFNSRHLNAYPVDDLATKLSSIMDSATL